MFFQQASIYNLACNYRITEYSKLEETHKEYQVQQQ